MDIRIICAELQEGGYLAHIYPLEEVKELGIPIYANTAPQVKAKILTRLSGMIDTILPANEPKEK